MRYYFMIMRFRNRLAWARSIVSSIENSKQNLPFSEGCNIMSSFPSQGRHTSIKLLLKLSLHFLWVLLPGVCRCRHGPTFPPFPLKDKHLQIWRQLLTRPAAIATFTSVWFCPRINDVGQSCFAPRFTFCCCRCGQLSGESRRKSEDYPHFH